MVDAFGELAHPSKPVNVVASTELTHPSHVFGLSPYLGSQPNSRVVDPASLRVDANGDLTDGTCRLNQVLLQLHQHQIEELGEDVLVAMGKVCYNDLRTIYLILDKRLLGLIRQELPWLVAEGIINWHQAAVLKRGLAETYFPGSLGYTAVGETAPRAQWTLKKALSGKGDGMVFGKNVSAVEWADLVAAKTHLPQRYYGSKRIDLAVRDRSEAEPTLKRVNWPIVGTLLVINDRILGVSVFRANDRDTIALSTSGTAIAGVTVPGVPPSIVLPDRPLTYLTPASSCIELRPGLSLQPEWVATIATALKAHCMAILRLPTGEEDPDSSYLSAISQTLGTPVSHSSSHGMLWDVTPSPSVSSGARSHGSDIFPWHTDCSYESAPPRYFGLHIVRPDRLQGGNLRLLSVSDLVAVHFTVPPEFDKGGAGETTGRVLTPGGKMRWGRDIIEGTTPAATAALEEVDRALEHLPGLVLGKDEMKAGVVVCIDNATWLHARSTVHDMARLLRRVRWEPELF